MDNSESSIQKLGHSVEAARQDLPTDAVETARVHLLLARDTLAALAVEATNEQLSNAIAMINDSMQHLEASAENMHTAQTQLTHYLAAIGIATSSAENVPADAAPPTPVAIPTNAANELFESFIQSATQLTAAERAALYQQDEVLGWLGDNMTSPRLTYLFHSSQPYNQAEPLSTEEASRLVGEHLTDIAPVIPWASDGERYAKALHDLTASYVGRVVVQQSDVREYTAGNGYQLYGMKVYVTEKEVVVDEQGGFGNEYFLSPPFERHDQPNGDVILIRTDAQERYRITRHDNEVTFVHEQIRELQPGDPAYFADLHEGLAAYSKLVHEVVALAGIDPEALTDPETGRFNASFLRNEVRQKVAALYNSGRVPPLIMQQMTGWVTALWEETRRRQEWNPETESAELFGIRDTGARVRMYFKTLLRSS